MITEAFRKLFKKLYDENSQGGSSGGGKSLFVPYCRDEQRPDGAVLVLYFDPEFTHKVTYDDVKDVTSISFNNIGKDSIITYSSVYMKDFIPYVGKSVYFAYITNNGIVDTIEWGFYLDDNYQIPETS